MIFIGTVSWEKHMAGSLLEFAMILEYVFLRGSILMSLAERIQRMKLLSKERVELIPGNIYLFKVNNRNTRKRCETCSKLTTTTPERHFIVLIVKFK